MDITKEIMAQAKTLMSDVAVQIGEGAEWGFEITMQRVIAEGIFEIIIGTIFTVVIVLLVIKSWKIAHQINEKVSSYDKGYPYFFAAMGTLLALMFLSFSIHEAKSGTLKLIAPEYATVEKLVDLVKPNVSNPNNR